MHLLEREIYLDALSAGLTALDNGRGCIALVSGEAGMGKSALIQQFASTLRKSVRLYWGSCEALFTPHPLAPLHDIARQAGGDLPAVLTAATNRELIFQATIDHFAQGLKPTVVIFEDVHWADEATLDLIKFLGRRLQRLPVMLVISYRDDEVSVHHPLRSVIGDLPGFLVTRISLPPLSEAAVKTMAQRAGRGAAGLREATGGNPFFVTETLAAPENAVPVTVRDAVLARISRLSDPARAVANLAAIVPGKLESWLLESVLAPADKAIEECLAAGMVSREQAIAFRHELARQAVENNLAAPIRQGLHARIMAALQARPQGSVPTARVVHHADCADDSSAVLQFAPVAAEEALSLGAHRQAAAHLATSLRHAASLSDEKRARLLNRLSYEYYLTGQITEAIGATELAHSLWKAAGDRYQEGDSLRWLSRLMWFTTNKAEADRYAALAVATLEPLPPGRELAMAYSNLAQLHMLADEAELTLVAGGKALELARKLGDTEIESHALNNVGTARLAAQDQTGYEDLERSLALALKSGFHEHAGRAYSNMATAAVRARQLARANRYFEQGIPYCLERDLYSGNYMIGARAEARLAQGDWDGATEDAELISRNSKMPPVAKIPALIALARVRARRGDPGVDAVLEEASALAFASSELQRIAPVVAARAEAAWLRGTLSDSVDEVIRAFELSSGRSDIWIHGELTFWLKRAGRLEKRTGRVAQPWALQLAGDWQGAAAAWAAVDCPYERAVALADSEEEVALREALQVFERLGAGPMTQMTRRRMRDLGIRNVPRGAQARTQQNPLELTRRQLQVLTLIGEGRRNADIARRIFVSEKTVDHHVTAILQKLEVHSRGEAAAIAHRLGLCTAQDPLPPRTGKKPT
jgi:DNA-binding CsgD family transcriptional regulator